MRCTACNKESNNRRVCPFCFTPYPAEGQQSGGSNPMNRGSTSQRAQPANPGPLEPLREFVMRQTPLVRWSGLGILLVGLLWLATGGETPTEAPVTTVPAGVTAPAMSRDEAVALIKHTRETALVEEQDGEVSVSYPAASFPVQPEGQVMLAMQFARADEAIQGRKRRIFFHSPSGRMFAQSDAVTGLTVVK